MAFDTSKLSTDELKALQDQIKAQLKDGISPADPVIEEIVGLIKTKAKEAGVPLEKFITALNKALGAGKAGSTGTRAITRSSVMRSVFKEAGVTIPVKCKTAEMEPMFIEKFGQARFDADIAIYPEPKVVKKA